MFVNKFLSSNAVTMSAAFHGGLEGVEQWVGNLELLSAISLAMDYWFSNDFTNIDCLASGGSDDCRKHWSDAFDYILDNC